MAKDVVDGDAGDDELFGGPADDVVKGGDGSDTLVGNFGDDVLLGGKGDDRMTGDNPPPPFPVPTQAPSRDVCNGQQGTDFAVEETCEQENQIELTGPFPEM
jgi:Ca2+-binding RTX toxin-like protein